MSRNDALDFVRRLYDRVPGHYRVYDAEQGRPLQALLAVIAEQVATVRQDLDALWDGFFIETCDDWVVPYIGELVGTNLLAHPVGQSNRLDVWNTVLWRRSKGTPRMLGALAQAISEWPADVAEFFQTLGWSQNMNHLRPKAVLTPDLRHRRQLDRLGRADDPFGHAADFKTARPLDQPRATRASLGIGRAAWGTPGRSQIRNVGFFARRLQTFAVIGGTPAAVAPGGSVPPDAACFTFDPLFRDIPLFVKQSRAPLSRAAFEGAPGEKFGTDVAVRQFGVLLAEAALAPAPQSSADATAFTFGGGAAGLSLHATAGIRLLDVRPFRAGGGHFVVTARWQQSGGVRIDLGALSTLRAALGTADAFRHGAVATGPGRLVVTVETGRAALGFPGLPASPAARFPGAVLAVRNVSTGPLRALDGLYVYLPPSFVTPSTARTYFVGTDGSTYDTGNLQASSLARASEGQVHPPRAASPGAGQPADTFTRLNRRAGGLRLSDPTRFGGVGVFIRAELFTGVFQPLGGVATINRAASAHPELDVPDPWPALTYGPSRQALTGDLPPQGLLTIQLTPLSGDRLPPAELIVQNRRGQSLLVYLPEMRGVPAAGVRFFVAEDGSTYQVPASQVAQLDVLRQGSLGGLPLARAAAGQVMPIAGAWPLQQRRPVAINLCRSERRALLASGELGVDPELGRFALAPGDPAVGQGGLSVDFVEAFTDRVGALNYDRALDPGVRPTRLVARTGDADSPLTASLAGAPVHASVALALAAARDGDVIEIVDSATYAVAGTITLQNPLVKRVTLRAGPGQRPCLTSYQGPGNPASGSLVVATPMSELELNGLLISGGPLRIASPVTELRLVACVLDPRTAVAGSLIASDPDPRRRAAYLLCRCITGGLRLGAGVSQLTIADSIVDQQGGLAIGGLSAPVISSPPGVAPSGSFAALVQLERVTVLGGIRCDVLHASECVLDDLVLVADRQAGCIRYTRYELGSVLPRRYQSVPGDDQAAACRPPGRCLPAVFGSRRFGRPDYAQLATIGPAELLTASEARAEVGAFASSLNPIRLGNLLIKLQEFIPVSQSAVVIAET
jgi:hypothetical protein